MSSNVTLKQIADALGVSPMTVSRVINKSKNVNEKTRQRVLEKARSMGYTPNHIAKSLVSRKTETIGVVIPEISHAFFPEVVRGIDEVTYQSNYQLILTNAAEKFEREKKAVNTLRSKRVDGILISSSQTVKDFSFYREIIKSGMPVVFFDRCVEGIGASCVSVNDRASSRLIVRHLIDHGYKKIAYLSGPPNVTIGKERLSGYQEVLKEAELPLNSSWIIESGFSEQGGYRAMNKILELPGDQQPRAVATVNDPVAIGAMEAIYEKGMSIPDDIAIVGFTDDVRARLMACPLTTVHQPAYHVGRKAAGKLVKFIENREEPIESIQVNTTIKIRSSCGCK